jgi:NADPH-dependent curcumin reductase CurA
MSLTATADLKAAASWMLRHPYPRRGRFSLLCVRRVSIRWISSSDKETFERSTDPNFRLCWAMNSLGVVIAVGRDVERFRAGDRVFARVAKDRGGAFAEQACVDEEFVAHMPQSLDFVAAAAVPLAGLTALQALRDELRIRPGQRLLISGAAGGVGTFAIQIAKGMGAQVTATASNRGEALVRSLGADEIIDYTRQDIAKVDRKFDAGLDLVGGTTLAQMSAMESDRARDAPASSIDIFSCIQAAATSLTSPN